MAREIHNTLILRQVGGEECVGQLPIVLLPEELDYLDVHIHIEQARCE